MNEQTTIQFHLLQQLCGLTDNILFVFQVEENKVLYLNEAFEKICPVSRESIESSWQALAEIVHPQDRAHAAEAFKRLQSEKELQNIELRLWQPDKPVKWIRINAWLMQYNGIDTIIGNAADITSYKEYGDTLFKFANKKNAILDILSHDLVSPIGNIQICAQVLRNHTKFQNDEVVEKMLNLITDNSNRSVRMIRDLVNKELLESSEAPLVLQRTDLIKRIAEVIEQYKRSYQTVKQLLQLESNVDVLFIAIDEAKFMQVINNLLSNALKFTRDTDEIKVIVEDEEKTVLIKVSDTGVGIPADMQPFIFDKFTKARRPGIHGEPTTGLGLSIIKTIIEWHKGSIWFESAEGKGTTFFIQIPKAG